MAQGRGFASAPRVLCKYPGAEQYLSLMPRSTAFQVPGRPLKPGAYPGAAPMERHLRPLIGRREHAAPQNTSDPPGSGL